MKLWCKAMALFLALLWVPVSSHCLLEIAELIHHDHCCQPSFGHDHSHGHDAADGNCQVESRQLAGPKQDVLKVYLLVSLLDNAAFSLPERTSLSGLISDGVAPPELRPTWQFVSRAAVSPRAPSILL
ncbi:MAG: hypothetical protein ACO1QS_05810 [Verrucomicrobiota bacterium]